jgi:hypothetical protein
MTHDDLPAPPTNTRWLETSDEILATDFVVKTGLLQSVPLSVVGSPAGEPVAVAGGWYFFARVELGI